MKPDMNVDEMKGLLLDIASKIKSKEKITDEMMERIERYCNFKNER